jgi:hypothetical protein
MIRLKIFGVAAGLPALSNLFLGPYVKTIVFGISTLAGGLIFWRGFTVYLNRLLAHSKIA